jgi:hypothetical protein
MASAPIRWFRHQQRMGGLAGGHRARRMAVKVTAVLEFDHRSSACHRLKAAHISDGRVLAASWLHLDR